MGHFVRFYDADSLLLDEVVEFSREALNSGGCAILIATQAHLSAMSERLGLIGPVGEGASVARGGIVMIDAEVALAGFMVDGWPDEARFIETIGSLIAKAAAEVMNGPVHAFGEMVAVLCAAGQYDAALRLEALWNALANHHSFRLFCAYPHGLFPNAEQSSIFEGICRAHTHVLPSELLTRTPASDTHRLIAQWQQKAAALEVEVERRRAAESALRRREQQLERANRAKDEFLAMLGHELRNPLSPIVTALQLMHMHPGAAALHELNIIERHVEHLVRLVDDLLDISRITSGKIELKKRTVPVEEVLKNAVEMASPLLEQRHHRLTMALQPDLAWTVDPTRLAQVVSNLLTNAARYTATGGTVRLTAWRDAGDTIAVSVQDNGIGIPKRMLPRVFDLFFQGKPGRDRTRGGLGIGLALVKSLVEMHGGRVSVVSAGPGRGSEFTIRVPAASPLRDAGSHNGAAIPAETAVKPPAGKGRRLLLVDDNIDAVEALALFLSLYGHDVKTAHDPVSALRIVGEFDPEIAVIDIGLPVMDGYELIGRLRTALEGRACSFIALTGYGQDDDHRRSREAGFDRHLVKPVDPRQVLQIIDELHAGACELRRNVSPDR